MLLRNRRTSFRCGTGEIGDEIWILIDNTRGEYINLFFGDKNISNTNLCNSSKNKVIKIYSFLKFYSTAFCNVNNTDTFNASNSLARNFRRNCLHRAEFLFFCHQKVVEIYNFLSKYNFNFNNLYPRKFIISSFDCLIHLLLQFFFCN